jgi:RNA polymerase sigma-70 factor, ECF subfamily
VPTDLELIEAFRRDGDRSALDMLIRRHLATVRGVIYSMVLDQILTDDLTQDALVRAVRGLQGFRGESMFSTWLVRIAMNCVRNYFDRRPPTAKTLSTDDVRSLAARDGLPVPFAIGQELDGAIAAALEHLTPRLRSAVVLISINGMSAHDASLIEGCSAATMHSRLHEARSRLKALLKGHLLR